MLGVEWRIPGPGNQKVAASEGRKNARTKNETLETSHWNQNHKQGFFFILGAFLTFQLVAISRCHKMKCVLCQRSNETTDTGALSSKRKVAAHQNCLVNISPRKEEKTKI